MKKILLKIIALTIVLLYSGYIEAETITVSGTYQGKNIYVKNNPIPNDSLTSCTSEVFVNDIKVVADFTKYDYEINLSGFKIGTKITIKIIHKNTCKPMIINPQVIK